VTRLLPIAVLVSLLAALPRLRRGNGDGGTSQGGRCLHLLRRGALGRRPPPGAGEGEGEGEIAYDFAQKVSPADAPRIAREYAQRGYKAVFGEAFECEEEMRRAARTSPKSPSVSDRGEGHRNPNFSVLDAYVHEPAYLCGLLAGKIAGSGTIGAVVGPSSPGVERTINAFRLGLKEALPRRASSSSAWRNATIPSPPTSPPAD